MKVQVILPGKVDSQADEKRMIWVSAGKRHGVDLKLPPLPSTTSEFVLSDAVLGLRESQLVVADVSFERPSCYFELGLAQALDVPVILLLVTCTVIHQHAPALGEYQYESLTDYEEIVDEILTERVWVVE